MLGFWIMATFDSLLLMIKECRTPHTEHRLSKVALQGLIIKPEGQIHSTLKDWLSVISD
jgi:hypothetical protein